MTLRQFVPFAARRLAGLVVVLLVLSFGIFSLLTLAPGSPEDVILGTSPRTPETLEAIREEHNLDEPFLSQYLTWLGNAVQLDFGRSIRTSQPVLSGIEERLPTTLTLAGIALVLTVILGVGIGTLAALKAGSGLDRMLVALSVVCVSAPAFASGLLLLYLFAVQLEWFPAFGEGSGVADRLWHLALPAVALSLSVAAVLVKLTRASMIQVFRQDYMAFARARGISPLRVLFAHGVRNGLVPVVTATGNILGYFFVGAVLVETTFALPGVGTLLLESVQSEDVLMIQGVSLLAATFIVTTNFLVDVAYVFIDPRIRLDATA